MAAASLGAARRPPGVLALRAALRRRRRSRHGSRASTRPPTGSRAPWRNAPRRRMKPRSRSTARPGTWRPRRCRRSRRGSTRLATGSRPRVARPTPWWPGRRCARRRTRPGRIHAEVLAARRRAREALDGARIAAASMVLATHDRSDVRASTRRIADDIEERLRTLLADPPVGPTSSGPGRRRSPMTPARSGDAPIAMSRRRARSASAVRRSGPAPAWASCRAHQDIGGSSSGGTSSSISGSSSGPSGSSGGGGTSSGGSW